MWSPSVPLAPVAAHLGLQVHIVYRKGDFMRTAKGKPVNLRAGEYYVSSNEVVAQNANTARGQVADFVRLLMADTLISRLVNERALDVVVWSAIFGDEGAAKIADLGIDTKPFGRRLGLVVENYTDFDETGNPRKLLIGPAASPKTAVGQ
jgi:hypothetical protein